PTSTSATTHPAHRAAGTAKAPAALAALFLAPTGPELALIASLASSLHAGGTLVLLRVLPPSSTLTTGSTLTTTLRVATSTLLTATLRAGTALALWVLGCLTALRLRGGRCR